MTSSFNTIYRIMERKENALLNKQSVAVNINLNIHCLQTALRCNVL